MAKITLEFQTLYDRGDWVIFEKNDIKRIGIIQSFYLEGNVVWYDIFCDGITFSANSFGDVGEFSIIGKITDNELIKKIKEFDNE